MYARALTHTRFSHCRRAHSKSQPLSSRTPHNRLQGAAFKMLKAAHQAEAEGGRVTSGDGSGGPGDLSAASSSLPVGNCQSMLLDGSASTGQVGVDLEAASRAGSVFKVSSTLSFCVWYCSSV